MLISLRMIDKFESFITSRLAFFVFTFSSLLYIFIGLINLYSPGGADYWHHLAKIYQFSTDLTATNNAYVVSTKTSFVNTPYHLFWGLVSKVINVHPFWLLPLIGAINHTIFITATVYLSKYLTNSRKYALIIALTLLFFWYKPWQWSGFYNFGLLPLTSIYSYWFAFPSSLLMISTIRMQGGFFHLFIYVIAMSMVFLVHPLTGSFLFLGVFIKGLTSYHEPIKNRLFVLFTPLFALLLSMLWPYYSVGDAIFKTSEYRYFLGPYWQFYVHPWKSLLPAFFGFLYIPIAIKYKQYNFVTIGLLFVILIFVANRFTFHNQYLSRYLIYICFFLQIAIVMLLKNTKTGSMRRLVFLSYVLLLVIFGIKQLYLSSSSWGLITDIKNGTQIGTHSNINYFNSYKNIRQFAKKDDVVFAPIYTSWILPGITGCRIVGSPHGDVFETDNEYYERWNDTNLFFQDSSFTNAREELINKYDVKYVLVPKSYNYSIFDEIGMLDSVYINHDYKLYKIQ